MTPAETRAAHFARLNDYRQTREYQDYAREIGVEVPGVDLPPLLGQRWEIDEDIYTDAEDMLPPYLWTPTSFYFREGLFGAIHAKYTREGDRYFCEYVRLPPPPHRANAPGMEP